MFRYLQRHQAGVSMRTALVAGFGGCLAVGLLGGLAMASGAPLLVAPFGASCVLLFVVPASPLSQPANVIGGHVLSTLIGVLCFQLLPDTLAAQALAVGLAISAMALLRVTHPPAGADPLVVFAAQAGYSFVVLPVLVGAVLLVAIAVAFHRLSRTSYPLTPAAGKA